MNNFEKMFFEIQSKAKETEIENKKKITQKGFEDGYTFSVYEYLRNTIPEIKDLEISHSAKDWIVIYKFFNSEYEFNFITTHREFHYPEFSSMDSIPSVEKYKDENIVYFKLKKLQNTVSKITYNFENKEIKERNLDLNNLEREIDLFIENLKKFIEFDHYEKDLERNPKKYREIDSVFERKAAEIGNEFVRIYFLNKKPLEISEIFNTKTLEKDLIRNLPPKANLLKYHLHNSSSHYLRDYA